MSGLFNLPLGEPSPPHGIWMVPPQDPGRKIWAGVNTVKPGFQQATMDAPFFEVTFIRIQSDDTAGTFRVRFDGYPATAAQEGVVTATFSTEQDQVWYIKRLDPDAMPADAFFCTEDRQLAWTAEMDPDGNVAPQSAIGLEPVLPGPDFPRKRNLFKVAPLFLDP